MTPDLKATLLNAIQQAATDNAHLLALILGVKVLIFSFQMIKKIIVQQTWDAEHDVDRRHRR
jgi:hypothetical protein